MLRRDATGPTGAGVVGAFAGTLKSIDKDWVCLSVDEKHEFWFPVASIQFIQFGSSETMHFNN